MWQRLGKFVLRFRGPLLILLTGITVLMGFYASKVKLSYEFSKAIPVDNPKYQEYQSFKATFGDDGNLLVAGIQTDSLFTLEIFDQYRELHHALKNVKHVEEVLSIPSAVNLLKDTATQKLLAKKIFVDSIQRQAELDSAATEFYNLPFYRSLLYNPETKAYLMGVRINRDVLNSAGRTQVINDITREAQAFQKKTNIEVHLSGLPLIRTVVADRIQQEMKFFLFGSLALSTLILLMFFRSISTTLLSLLVVVLGVIWSVGVLYLCGYQITLLTALVPCLVVVIGIPNCIYFINKYHSSYTQSGNKEQSLVDMVSKMGVVTLFCNLTAAIGFAVFALTKSAILQEFGVVAGISIMIIFVVSFILLPAALSYLPAPRPSQTRYLNNKWIINFLLRIERWVLNHKRKVYVVTAAVMIFSVIGIFKLKSVSFIVDDLPKTDRIYTDLKFFEKNFHGVMPLEIVVDTKKRNGLAGMRALNVYAKVDELSAYIASRQEMSRPLSVAEGLKFAKQAFFEGDSVNYLLPNSFDGAFVGEYLRPNRNETDGGNNLSKMLTSFIDSNRQSTRVSVNMADVGTEELPELLQGIKTKASEIFDTANYNIQLTGTSITFLEGSRFIINGLEDSIFWAFLLIALCMLYLFKSGRILLCSLIPNIIPLVITAGIMGWMGVPLKPSTVLVFSVALGIAVDITIRFLVNYKQELPLYNNNILETVSATIKHTGLSIVYTALVLIAGFVIFCASDFGGTKALGWLTSATLFIATLTNLVLLPVLLLWLAPDRSPKKRHKEVAEWPAG